MKRQKMCGLLLFISILTVYGFKHAAATGMGCVVDSDCGFWNDGEDLKCNSHLDCISGRKIQCDSSYHCGLSCNGVCNNFFHVCDGTCNPIPGLCDPSTCSGEVCLDVGSCGVCGDGNCDPGEDSNNCPQDCGSSSTSTTTTTSTSSSSTTSSSTSVSTSVSTSTISPPPGGRIQLQSSGFRDAR